MLKWLYFCVGALIGAFAISHADAGGFVPAVNSDMGCSATGQMLGYNGSNIVCGVAPKMPSAITSGLPTCNAGAAGLTYLVTDALLPAALGTLTGGGAVVVSVVCTGTAYIVQ